MPGRRSGRGRARGGLRVVLRIDIPALAALPREAMYDQAAERTCGGRAISVTFGRRKKEQRALYMTPQQARAMAAVIRRKVRPAGEIAKILQQEDRP